MEKDIGKPVIQFKIPYPWKYLLAGLFWRSTATLIGFTVLFFFIFGISYYFWLGVTGFFILAYGIYFLFKYIEIKYDKIKSPIEITITDTHMIYKKGDALYTPSFENIKRVDTVLDDKELRMKCTLEEPEEDATACQFRFRRKDELGEVDYKEFAEKTFIPSAKYMIKRIKELNPDVVVTWEDKRKKYR